MTKEELFEKFDTAAATKAAIAIQCIRSAKTISSARWQAIEMNGELEGLYRGYTDVGEMINVCESLDEMFFVRMFYYRDLIEEELAIFITNHKRKRK